MNTTACSPKQNSRSALTPALSPRERERERERTGAASYLCQPLGDVSSGIVQWSVIERCRSDDEIERAHLESEEVQQRFGDFNPATQDDRQSQIRQFLRQKFPSLLASAPRGESGASLENRNSKFKNLRLGFDVAASGQGDLAVIYIDEPSGAQLSLRALFTCRTQDWHFLKTVLFTFFRHLPNLVGAGDQTGLGNQICWEAAKLFPGRFSGINFSSRKHELGFALLNQLSHAEKRFPRSHEDIAADFFALRKSFQGNRWVFHESPNPANPASHCDIAWAAALATEAHLSRKSTIGFRLG